jgi:uncharacterized membrane protein HdeD (DUF308 family)
MGSVISEVADRVGSDLKRLRWALGINGALSVALGVVILVWPSISLYSLVIVFGAFTAANGVVGLAMAISGPMRRGRGWLVFYSLASIVVGVITLIWTGMSALALLYVIGAYAIALGIITAGGAFMLPLEAGDRALLILVGLAGILFGVVMFAKPSDGALVLLALIAAFFLVRGFSELVIAIGGEKLLLRDFKRAFAEARPGPGPS